MNESYEQRAKKEKTPIQFRLYKGIKGNLGALRLNLKRPYTNPDPKKSEGVVFLEAAPTIGPNDYDWENQKIIIALNITDIPKIILYLQAPNHPSFERTENKLKIMHDKGAGTANKGKQVTSLQIDKPSNMNNFMFSLYSKDYDKNCSAQITVSPDEAIAMRALLTAAIPILLSWTPNNSL